MKLRKEKSHNAKDLMSFILVLDNCQNLITNDSKQLLKFVSSLNENCPHLKTIIGCREKLVDEYSKLSCVELKPFDNSVNSFIFFNQKVVRMDKKIIISEIANLLKSTSKEDMEELKGNIDEIYRQKLEAGIDRFMIESTDDMRTHVLSMHPLFENLSCNI